MNHSVEFNKIFYKSFVRHYKNNHVRTTNRSVENVKSCGGRCRECRICNAYTFGNVVND